VGKGLISKFEQKEKQEGRLSLEQKRKEGVKNLQLVED
jgi:hypothetical protein